VIPRPKTEVIGESGSGGLGAVPPNTKKGLILHVLRIAEHFQKHIDEYALTKIFHFTHDMEARNILQSAQDG